MLFTRVGLGQRPHLLGANISNYTLTQLQSINGSLALTFDGYTYSANINLSGVTSFTDAAHAIQAALNSHRQVAAVTAGEFDRAGIGFVHGVHRSRTTLRHVGLVRQH